MIASPCINICAMNPQTGLCAGCYRTIDEITAWARLNDPGRREVLAAVAQRRQVHQLQEEDCAAMTNDMDNEDPYICVGICMADPDSGYCLGCGRPPLESPDVVAEIVVPAPKPASNGPDDPE